MSKNIGQISFTEAFNNDNGKTSGNKLLGLITTFVCLFVFIALIIYYFINPSEGSIILQFIDKDIFFYGIGSGVMIGKTFAASFGSNNRMTIADNNQQNINHNNQQYNKKKHNNKRQNIEEENEGETTDEEL